MVTLTCVSANVHAIPWYNASSWLGEGGPIANSCILEGVILKVYYLQKMNKARIFPS